MGRCPECDEETDHFNAHSPATIYYTVYLDSRGGLDYNHEDTDEHGDNEYECPHCNAELAYDEVVQALEDDGEEEESHRIDVVEIYCNSCDTEFNTKDGKIVKYCKCRKCLVD